MSNDAGVAAAASWAAFMQGLGGWELPCECSDRIMLIEIGGDLLKNEQWGRIIFC